jgi:hypothetical protein
MLLKEKQAMKFEWEEIYTSEDTFHNVYTETFRAKVVGGWLIRHQMLVDEERERTFDGWSNCHNSMVFIPDPEHLWEVDYE